MSNAFKGFILLTFLFSAYAIGFAACANLVAIPDHVNDSIKNKVVIAGILAEYADVNEELCVIRIRKGGSDIDLQDAIVPIKLCKKAESYVNRQVRIAGHCQMYRAPSNARLCLPVVEAIEIYETPVDPHQEIAPVAGEP